MLTPETRWVLLAEDDEDIRSIIKSSIASEASEMKVAVEVIDVANGAEALSKAKDQQFHCVVTDLRMPGISGQELLRSLRTDPLNANTPTLVVSGFANADFIDEFSHIKVIPKPFVPQAVAAAVLREIRLGRMDDRASIQFMNPFLETASLFVEQKLLLPVSPEQPTVKRAGEELRGDYHCMIALAAGPQTARFAFSFDRALLKYAKTKFFQALVAEQVQLQPETVARSMTQLFADETLTKLEPFMGSVPKLTRLSVVTSKSPSDYNDLVNTAGITVAVKTDQGNLYAGAFSKPKKKHHV